MAIEIGSIVQGKITGLARYGAFVALEGGAVGMVHISEVSWQFVNDLSQVLEVGSEVSVKVLKVDESGRYSLSIKKAQPQSPSPRRPAQENADYAPPRREPRPEPSQEDVDASFEDKLKKFMQSSDSRISDLKHNTDRKNGSRRGRH